MNAKTIGVLALILVSVGWMAPGFGQVTRSQVVLVTASSYDPVEPGSRVSVRVYGEAPDMQDLQAQAEAAMMARGFLIASSQPDLVVGIELTEQLHSQVQRGLQPRPEDRGEITARATERQNPDEVFGETARGRPRVGRANPTLVMTLSINDRANGRRLWQGRAATDSPTELRAQVITRMLPPLADAIGETVREKTVPLLLN